jgi:hypothetical protein
MKRLIWLLLPLLLFLTACASGSDEFAPDDVAEPGAEAAPTVAQATAASAAPTADEAADPAATPADTASTDDPTLARERDWKLGDLAEPAVTIIEYGDFQ